MTNPELPGPDDAPREAVGRNHLVLAFVVALLTVAILAGLLALKH